MSRPLCEVVTFRGDKLFNGAVSIDWYSNDEARSRAASQAFVFHGPEYHGVSQADVGTTHGYRLTDTASFVRSLVRRCYGVEEEPFTLAIAGYGTGKSHLGLTAASLLDDPQGETAQVVLAGIDAADPAIGADIRAILRDAGQPCLVVALNGMQSFDLTNQVTQQILRQLQARNLDTSALDELRPRFSQAASLVRMANQEVVDQLLAECDVESIEGILSGLERQDELTYRGVHDVFSRRGMAIAALRGESVRDIVDATVRAHCGPDKSYRTLVVLFDEFGRYTEFATVRSQIAGSGVLQDLFEGIQANSANACFAGFIQFELNAYVQRIAPEYRNDILRYVTRYQAANRVYLSINMETLVAHLIEKKCPDQLVQWFDNSEAKAESAAIMGDISRWFPQSGNHRLWQDADQFHTVIRKGCWPLSPYSTWFLFHLAAAGKHLQERSALALLGQLFERCCDWRSDSNGASNLAPVEFWSDALQQELITSEEGGQQGAITHAYVSVEARHGANLSDDCKRLARAVVLASKMGLKAAHRRDATDALTTLAGLSADKADNALRLLQDEYNVLEWDDASKQFDILGDAVPRTQFLSFVRQRVASTFDDAGKAVLFASKARDVCELLSDLECDFAEANRITTREWRYQAVTSNLDNLPMDLKLASDRWKQAVAVDEARGTIIYCYVAPGRDSPSLESEIGRLLRAAAKEAGVPVFPVLVVLLHDDDGSLGQALAEFAVVEESVSKEERARFGSLIPAHTEKLQKAVRSSIESMIKQRRYVTCFKDGLESKRLDRAGTELFSRSYKLPVTFPFDGFSTARGNAADSCQDLTTELLLGKLDYDAVMGKPIKVKNRAIAVLKDAWDIFGQNGRVLTRPKHPVIRTLAIKWDEMLAGGERRLLVGQVLEQLCLPPHGANVASAGLLLGAFIAPRVDKLMVVRGGQRYAVSQWIQDGVFRGKFMDINALKDAYLVAVGEDSSEWNLLLNEWEEAESHSVRASCLERSTALEERVPIPPSLHFRVVHLRKLAQDALNATVEMEKKQNDAFSKVENGCERNNVALVAWGAASLQDLRDQMRTETPLWDDHQIEELEPHIERGRQLVIHDFADWLARQMPKDDKPDTVGEFKHRMLHQTGGNLKKLSLDAEVEALQKHVATMVRNVETAAEARQLIRDVRSWLTTHGRAHRVVRIADSRGLLAVGKDFGGKLQGMVQRIGRIGSMAIAELGEVRTQLYDSLVTIDTAIAEVLKRATRLWNVKLRSVEDLENCLEEIDALVIAFEGCDNDLKDLHMMRRALRVYQDDYKRLCNERLTWEEFDRLVEDCRKTASELIEEGDVPWPPQEVIDAFSASIAKQRKEASTEWIEAVEQASQGVASMSAAEANRLHERANSPPAVLTEQHAKRLQKTINATEKRLDALKLDWLLEKYKELNSALRKTFLRIINEI